MYYECDILLSNSEEYFALAPMTSSGKSLGTFVQDHLFEKTGNVFFTPYETAGSAV